MDIYIRLPTDLQKIIDKLLHQMYYSDVVNQINRVFRDDYYLNYSIKPYMYFFNGHVKHFCSMCEHYKKGIKYYYKNISFIPDDIQLLYKDSSIISNKVERKEYENKLIKAFLKRNKKMKFNRVQIDYFGFIRNIIFIR